MGPHIYLGQVATERIIFVTVAGIALALAGTVWFLVWLARRGTPR